MIVIVAYASPDHLLLTNISVIVHNPDRTPLLVLLGRSKWRRQAPQTSSPVSFITVTKSESSPGKNHLALSHLDVPPPGLCLIFKRVATRRKCRFCLAIVLAILILTHARARTRERRVLRPCTRAHQHSKRTIAGGGGQEYSSQIYSGTAAETCALKAARLTE